MIGRVKGWFWYDMVWLMFGVLVWYGMIDCLSFAAVLLIAQIMHQLRALVYLTLYNGVSYILFPVCGSRSGFLQKEHHPDNDFLDPDLWVDVCLLLVVSGMMVSNGKMQHGLPTSRCGAINWSWTGWVRIHWWTGLSLDGLTWFFGWFLGMIYGIWKCSCQTLKILFLNMFCWNFDGAWPCWFYLYHFRTCICISVLSKNCCVHFLEGH